MSKGKTGVLRSGSPWAKMPEGGRAPRKSLVEAVKAKAKEMNVPLYAIEEKAGLANGSISKWGKNSPSVDKVKKVADVLGVRIDDLV